VKSVLATYGADEEVTESQVDAAIFGLPRGLGMLSATVPMYKRTGRMFDVGIVANADRRAPLTTEMNH